MTYSVDPTIWKPWVRTAVAEIQRDYPTTSAGTYPGHEPTEALAGDFMIPEWSTAAGIALGDRLAHQLANVATCKRLGIWYIIWRGRIWSMTRPEEGWLPYFDRNNPNPSRSHKNHVHVSWYSKPPLPMPQPTPVTMWVRPAADPVWDPTAKTHVLSNVLADGAIGKKERPPGYKITGHLITIWGRRWLQTSAGNLYRLDYLSTTQPQEGTP